MNSSTSLDDLQSPENIIMLMNHAIMLPEEDKEIVLTSAIKLCERYIDPANQTMYERMLPYWCNANNFLAQLYYKKYENSQEEEMLKKSFDYASIAYSKMDDLAKIKTRNSEHVRVNLKQTMLNCYYFQITSQAEEKKDSELYERCLKLSLDLVLVEKIRNGEITWILANLYEYKGKEVEAFAYYVLSYFYGQKECLSSLRDTIERVASSLSFVVFMTDIVQHFPKIEKLVSEENPPASHFEGIKILITKLAQMLSMSHKENEIEVNEVIDKVFAEIEIGLIDLSHEERYGRIMGLIEWYQLLNQQFNEALISNIDEIEKVKADEESVQTVYRRQLIELGFVLGKREVPEKAVPHIIKGINEMVDKELFKEFSLLPHPKIQFALAEAYKSQVELHQVHNTRERLQLAQKNNTHYTNACIHYLKAYFYGYEAVLDYFAQCYKELDQDSTNKKILEAIEPIINKGQFDSVKMHASLEKFLTYATSSSSDALYRCQSLLRILKTKVAEKAGIKEPKQKRVDVAPKVKKKSKRKSKSVAKPVETPVQQPKQHKKNSGSEESKPLSVVAQTKSEQTKPKPHNKNKPLPGRTTITFFEQYRESSKKVSAAKKEITVVKTKTKTKTEIPSDQKEKEMSIAKVETSVSLYQGMHAMDVPNIEYHPALQEIMDKVSALGCEIVLFGSTVRYALQGSSKRAHDFDFFIYGKTISDLEKIFGKRKNLNGDENFGRFILNISGYHLTVDFVCLHESLAQHIRKHGDFKMRSLCADKTGKVYGIDAECLEHVQKNILAPIMDLKTCIENDPLRIVIVMKMIIEYGDALTLTFTREELKALYDSLKYENIQKKLSQKIYDLFVENETKFVLNVLIDYEFLQWLCPDLQTDSKALSWLEGAFRTQVEYCESVSRYLKYQLQKIKFDERMAEKIKENNFEELGTLEKRSPFVMELSKEERIELNRTLKKWFFMPLMAASFSEIPKESSDSIFMKLKDNSLFFKLVFEKATFDDLRFNGQLVGHRMLIALRSLNFEAEPYVKPAFLRDEFAQQVSFSPYASLTMWAQMSPPAVTQGFSNEYTEQSVAPTYGGPG